VGKLVVLKLGDGNFEQGFPVTLQIGEDGDRPSTEITGKLPPAPEIPQHYSCWQSAYRRLGLRSRLAAPAVQVTNVSIMEDCYKAAHVLRNRLNTWLNSESFRSIREKLLEKLMPSDEVRLLLQTEDIQLQRLPWHLCDLFERYTKAEIALSAPVYESIKQASPPRAKVRILAILGNSAGIDTAADQCLLKQLPNAEISFLVEPQRKEVTEKLWGHGWDILFFAGHSSSQAIPRQSHGIPRQSHGIPRQSHGNEEGISRIYINQTDSLTIGDLRYALQTAVEQGLKLAIFNSCDGLGLAQELASLHIPQLVVMREPVPDQVAQKFLKYFLKAFAGGKSLYLAVREARERLQGLEDQFPCATWLPVICQNPGEVPPTWRSLRGVFKCDRQVWCGRRSLRTVFLTSVVITSLVMGVRHLGMFQSLELQAFDQLMRHRPESNPDPRLLVVTVTEADVQAQKQRQGGSLSDGALAQLLKKLGQFKPRVIGLDIYHDLPVEPNHKDLATRLRSNDEIIAVCKGSESENNNPEVKPPAEIPPERLGFSDIVVDPDGILRRHLLALTPNPASPCTASYAFSAQLAFRYLEANGILVKFTPEGYLQLGTIVFKPLSAHTGGYHHLDARGHQVLLNYRSSQKIAQQVTLTQVLNGQINPNSVKDRIVLIGTTAESFNDYHSTPYQEMPGVLIQAQMVSQILSAVLDQRPLLWVWSWWGEALWIWGWSLLGGILAWRLQPLHLGLTVAAAGGTLYGLCFGLLIQGGWVPLVPSALALAATGGSVVVVCSASQTQRQQKTYVLQSSEL